ncbi:MAG: hypothetical protein U0Q16_05235 [Bryobacteraceae bacterium]
MTEAIHSKKKLTVEQRAILSAEGALAQQQFVSAIDVLLRMQLLAPSHVAAWRAGRVECLEEVIQGSPAKISAAIVAFREWARQKGLRPSETRYVRTTREGTLDLRFSFSGDEATEQAFRTHYVSPALSERKQQQLTEKLNRTPETVVFQIIRDSQCSECGVELEKGSLLLMEAEQPLCLACAKLDELEFLAAGDTALTRPGVEVQQAESRGGPVQPHEESL